MANPLQDSPLKTLYRLTVMLGVLACGTMAALKYGPQADELAGMIDSAATRFGMEVDPQPTAIEPQPFLNTDAQPIAMPGLSTAMPDEAPPRFDPAVRPAAALEPIAGSPVPEIDSIDRERLIAPVLAAGAARANVSRWADGQYRATAAVSVGDSASGLYRQFDVQDSTPELAARELLRQVQTEASR